MKRSWIIPIVIVVSLAFVQLALASASLQADTYVLKTSPNNNYGTATSLAIQSSASLGPCDASSIAYLRWSLTGTAGAAGDTTKLVLRVSFVGSGSTGNVELFQVADDNWIESGTGGITYANAPVIGASIASVSMPAAAGLVTFQGAALANYINQETAYIGGGDAVVGNDLASFAVKITGCTGPSSVIAVDSREKSGGTPPSLLLFGPNAVTLTTFRASNPTMNWPLIIAGLLLVAALAGFGVYRWRLSRVQAR